MVQGKFSVIALRSHPPPGRAGAEGEREMTSYDPDPNLPDDISIGEVRLPPTIKRALAAAGLKTVGDVRKTSDAMLLSIQKLGRSSVTRLRNELGRRGTPLKAKRLKAGFGLKVVK
jgi:DNA-directed RNA polymerase alpha subunit